MEDTLESVKQAFQQLELRQLSFHSGIPAPQCAWRAHESDRHFQVMSKNRQGQKDTPWA